MRLSNLAQSIQSAFHHHMQTMLSLTDTLDGIQIALFVSFGNVNDPLAIFVNSQHIFQAGPSDDAKPVQAFLLGHGKLGHPIADSVCDFRLFEVFTADSSQSEVIAFVARPFSRPSSVPIMAVFDYKGPLKAGESISHRLAKNALPTSSACSRQDS